MNVRGRLLQGRTTYMAMAHQQLLMRAWKRPKTEKDHHDTAKHSHAAFAKQSGKSLGSQAGCQKHGPGADAECQHQQGAIERIALARGP
jgi:hypothetical protein